MRSSRGGSLLGGSSRGVILQLLLVLGVALFIAFIVANTKANLERAGLSAGYGFLWDTSAFDINQRLISYDSTNTYGRAFIVGGLNTVLVASMGVVAATIIGFLAGILRLSRNYLVSRIVTVYVEFTRNVPLLLQIIFWWVILLALPRVRDSIQFAGAVYLNNRGVRMPAPVFEQGSAVLLIALVVGVAATVLVARWARATQDATGRKFPVGWTGLGLVVGLPLVLFFVTGRPIGLDMPEMGRFNLQGGFNVTPELVALWLALASYTGAFISEIVRGGILSVSKGQTEAAGALGLPRGLTLRKVILPQALRAIVPPLTSQYLNLTKNSSLAVAIGYQDLVSIGDTILNQSGQALEVISIYMVTYLTLSLLTSTFMNWYNGRIALVER
ncbi:MAG: amino acid ABC transporter permease [Spirochaetaceae bacterium]|nr:amino acid ABC transporter permease [Spirochaetaceae bacterium]